MQHCLKHNEPRAAFGHCWTTLHISTANNCASDLERNLIIQHNSWSTLKKKETRFSFYAIRIYGATLFELRCFYSSYFSSVCRNSTTPDMCQFRTIALLVLFKCYTNLKVKYDFFRGGIFWVGYVCYRTTVKLTTHRHNM